MLPKGALPLGKAEGCLSRWQLSQLALGRSDAQGQNHADGCALCAQRLHEERELIAAAALERLPQALLARAQTLSWRRLSARYIMPWALVGTALGAGAVVLARALAA